MAPQKGTRATLVKLAQVEEAEEFLRSLPEKAKEDLSLKDAIDQLREPLQAALAKGYSYQDLASQLEKQGIHISATTLKNYLPSGRRGSKGPSTSTRKRAAKRVESPAATSVDSSESSQDNSTESQPPEKTSRRSSRGTSPRTNSKSTTGSTRTSTGRTKTSRATKK